mgnify:CR=1 FL=1
MSGSAWGSDVPVSQPSPLDDPDLAQVQFGGFCFTPSGIAHAVTQADLDQIYAPMFAPEGATKQESTE